MPDLRAVILALGVGVGIALLTIVVWRVPVALGAGAGVLLGGIALTGAVSVRVHGAAADAAWREAAPDLVDAPAGPSEGVGIVAEALTAAPAAPSAPRARDVPSGD